MQVLQNRTIHDFGEQWTRYPENRGYYASAGLLEDILAPLVHAEEIRGCRVAEIGSGTGRIVHMLLNVGADQVVALEPSDGFRVLEERFHDDGRVTLLHATGEQLPASGDLDFVFSIGVLHHIPDPVPVVRAACQALRPGGKLAIWVYAQEGNERCLRLLAPLRKLTTMLPHALLSALVWLFYVLLVVYRGGCCLLPLPLHQYLCAVWWRFDPPTRRLAIYDQLNPAYAKYYTRGECLHLLQAGGLEDIQLYHRHGYSWTAVGTKPIEH